MSEQQSVQLTVTDPRDDTVVELATHPTDALVQLALELRARQEDMQQRRETVEAELRGRLEHADRAGATIGLYTLTLEAGRSREWDVDELEGVLSELVSQGTVDAGEVADVIQTERKVSGRAAEKLLGQLAGASRAAIADCFHWRQRGKPRLKIEPRQLERGG